MEVVCTSREVKFQRSTKKIKNKAYALDITPTQFPRTSSRNANAFSASSIATGNGWCAGIAVPLAALAAAEGMPPLLTHTSLVLHNWHRLDPSGPVRTENLACNCRFLGGLDETWFYIATVEIEARGGGVFGALLEVRGWLL